MGFVHLQVKTAYDLLSSTASIENLIQKAKAYHYPALAITDKNVLYGVVEFYEKCLAAGIKPLIGMTVTLESVINPLHTYELILLAETTEGYHNLLKISSAIKTRTEKEMLPINWLKNYACGLIAIAPTETSEIDQLLHHGERKSAQEAAAFFRHLFGEEHFYLSIQKEKTRFSERILAFAKEENLSLVATKNVQYIEKEDAQGVEVLKAIRDNKTVDWTRLPPEGPSYFASEEEMNLLYTSPAEQLALLKTGEIADRCKVKIAMHEQLLPKYPLKGFEQASEKLKKEAFHGLTVRQLADKPEYVNRLHYELSVINQMGFADYFLIIWDLLKYARNANILTGPGRGSAAGSLVAYALQITDVDPLLYKLLFERFLNPERVTMPDIDIDFPDDKRDEIIAYVVKKYGTKHVAQIGTFGTLAAKAAIRDTARVFGLNAFQLAEWSKLIPGRLGMTLAKARQQNPRLEAFIRENKQNEMVFKIATQIEGLPRHISTHAAGVVISDEPLVKKIPLQKGSNDTLLTQYAMGDLEKIGLLKMDFLGLRNLSLLDRVLKTVNKTRGLHLTLKDIPLNDAKTLSLFQKGDTIGVFQFESDGIRRVLRNLKPTNFEDIVAVDALYRPGPMEQIDTFIARKHKKENVSYPHPDLKPILEVTYGVIVYQEQIMQVASQMAGFSLGEADLLRRAVSKKKRAVLDERRRSFVEGARRKGYTEKSAHAVYDMIIQFANYGFNRSHAAAYSKIAFQLAYLKAHFSAEFMAVLLSSVCGNDSKTAEYITEAKNHGLQLLSPHINQSGYYYHVVGSNEIRFGFRIIRNLPGKVILQILEERKKEPFKDFFDFCERMPSKMLNKPLLESLVFAGCFDCFCENRATLIASIDGALKYSALLGDNEEKSLNLFSGNDDLFASMKPRYRIVPEFDKSKLLDHEKECTGQYVSSHPVAQYKHILTRIGGAELSSLQNGKVYQVASYIHETKLIRTRKGEKMCFLKLSDHTKEISAVMFPESFRKYSSLINKGELLFLKIKAEERNGTTQAIIQHAEKLAHVRLPKQLFLRIKKNALAEVKTILVKYKGSVGVVVHYPEIKRTIALSKHFYVNENEALIKELEVVLGKGNAIFK